LLFGHVIASLVMAPSTGTTRYAVLREDGVGGEGDDESSGVHADDTDDAPVPFWDEARGQINMALPVSLSMVCNRVLSLTSVAFVGHLGALPLAATLECIQGIVASGLCGVVGEMQSHLEHRK
jgi:hypothetical protein